MFNRKVHPDKKVGAVIDVGSGSVGAAIVYSDKVLQETKIIWSHRENILLKSENTPASVEQSIRTALVNVFLELGNIGLKALNDYDNKARISEILVSMSAPWTYISTKNVTYENEKEFVVSEKLLNDLSKMASEEASRKVYDNDIFTKFGVKIISQKDVAIRIDGYQVNDDEYEGKSATELSFTHLTNLATEELANALDEIREKILPKAKMTVLPFMYVFYKTLYTQYSNTLEACLLDITNEATEFSIIRNGALKSSSYLPIGSFTIAREIAVSLKIPEEQAFSYLRKNPEDEPLALNATQKKQLAKIISDYQDNLTDLFKNTGDDLAIPRSIFVHTDINTSDFFNYVMKTSANKTTNSMHTVHPVTEKLITESHFGDTAILIAVKYYTDELD